jgi:hypothetical protein
MHQTVFGYSATQTRTPPEEPVHRKPFKLNTGIMSSKMPGSVFGEFLNEGTLPLVSLNDVPLFMRVSADQESARLLMETRVIQNLIYSYFKIVKKTISDMVPKTIMAFLINESRKMAQSELVTQIYKAGNLEGLLVEDPLVVQQREQCRKVIEALKAA